MNIQLTQFQSVPVKSCSKLCGKRNLIPRHVKKQVLDIGITHANWSRHTICLDDQAMQLRLVALNKTLYDMDNSALCFSLAKI